MLHSKISGIGYYVPEQVVTNDDLTKVMETTDEWIQERTGIQERRYGKKHKETTTTMGAKAASIAIERAGIRGAAGDLEIDADGNLISTVATGIGSSSMSAKKAFIA